MQHLTRELTEGQYNRIMETSKGIGVVVSEVEREFFTAATLWGYGLYGTRAYEKDGKYYLDYTIGDSCD